MSTKRHRDTLLGDVTRVVEAWDASKGPRWSGMTADERRSAVKGWRVTWAVPTPEEALAWLQANPDRRTPAPGDPGEDDWHRWLVDRQFHQQVLRKHLWKAQKPIAELCREEYEAVWACYFTELPTGCFDYKLGPYGNGAMTGKVGIYEYDGETRHGRLLSLSGHKPPRFRAWT